MNLKCFNFKSKYEYLNLDLDLLYEFLTFYEFRNYFKFNDFKV